MPVEVEYNFDYSPAPSLSFFLFFMVEAFQMSHLFLIVSFRLLLYDQLSNLTCKGTQTIL